jgi:hypothetical protein
MNRSSRLRTVALVAGLGLLIMGGAAAGVLVGRSPAPQPRQSVAANVLRVMPTPTASPSAMPDTAPPTPAPTLAPPPSPTSASPSDALAVFRENILPDIRAVSLTQNEAAALCGSPEYAPCYSALTNRAVAIQTLLRALLRFPSPPSAAQGIADLRAWTSALIKNSADAQTLFERASRELGFAVY